MVSRILFACLLTALCSTTSAQATLIIGAPPRGPVTLHNGTFEIDLNGDGTSDLTVSVRGVVSNGIVQGSNDWVYQAMSVGIFRGIWSGGAAWPLNVGQQVGPSTGDFLYSAPGLLAISEISASGEFVNPADYTPGWADGEHHFMGVDVPSGSSHHFGWVEMSLQDSGVSAIGEPWYDVTIYKWAYDTDPNQPITIPEPSSAAVVLLGLAAALMRRGTERACRFRSKASGVFSR